MTACRHVNCSKSYKLDNRRMIPHNTDMDLCRLGGCSFGFAVVTRLFVPRARKLDNRNSTATDSLVGWRSVARLRNGAKRFSMPPKRVALAVALQKHTPESPFKATRQAETPTSGLLFWSFGYTVTWLLKSAGITVSEYIFITPLFVTTHRCKSTGYDTLARSRFWWCFGADLYPWALIQNVHYSYIHSLGFVTPQCVPMYTVPRRKTDSVLIGTLICLCSHGHTLQICGHYLLSRNSILSNAGRQRKQHSTESYLP